MTDFCHLLSFVCDTNFKLPDRKTRYIPRAILRLSNEFMQAEHASPAGKKSGMEMAHVMFDALFILGLEPQLADSDGCVLRDWERQEALSYMDNIKAIAKIGHNLTQPTTTMFKESELQAFIRDERIVRAKGKGASEAIRGITDFPASKADSGAA